MWEKLLLGGWTPEKSWWWGALLGDGCVHVRPKKTYRVAMVGSESTTRRWIRLLHPDRLPKKVKRKKAFQTYFDSKPLTEYLSAQGLRGPKAHDLPWPEGVPAVVFPHFLRGLWDTDGSLSVWDRRSGGHPGNPELKARYASACRPFVERLNRELSGLLGLPESAVTRNVSKKKKHEWWSLSYSGPAALRIANALYSGAPESLRNEDRYEVFLQMLGERDRQSSALCPCGRPVQKEGRCTRCWWAARPKRTGRTVACACGKPVAAKGKCSTCYSRDRRAGAEAGSVEAVVASLRKGGFPKVQVPPGDVLGKVAAGAVTVDEGLRTVRSLSISGQRFCSAHHPWRFLAKCRGGLSAVEAWSSDEHLRRAVRYQIGHGDPTEPRRVLRAVCALNRVPTNFSPVLARWLVDRFCPVGGRVLDPCAGFGGRLLGTLASTKGATYLGFDIEAATQEGNRKLVASLGLEARTLLEVRAVEGPEPWPEADLLLTGPPYFDREVYGAASSEALRKYATFESWLRGFGGALLRKGLAAAPRIVLDLGTFRRKNEQIDLVTAFAALAPSCGGVVEPSWSWVQPSFGRASPRLQTLLVLSRKV